MMVIYLDGKKLGDAGRYICTVRKVGYKLADNEEGEEE